MVVFEGIMGFWEGGSLKKIELLFQKVSIEFLKSKV